MRMNNMALLREKNKQLEAYKMLLEKNFRGQIRVLHRLEVKK
jgi:hypothetical protein